MVAGSQAIRTPHLAAAPSDACSLQLYSPRVDWVELPLVLSSASQSSPLEPLLTAHSPAFALSEHQSSLPPLEHVNPLSPSPFLTSTPSSQTLSNRSARSLRTCVKGTQQAGHKPGLAEERGDFVEIDPSMFLPIHTKLSQQF